MASEYWTLEKSQDELKDFNAKIVEDIYKKEISGGDQQRIKLLEFSHYLENYLWPNYNESSSTHGFCMSIVFLVNEKFKERIEVWKVFEESPEHFSFLFNQILQQSLIEIQIQKATPALIREQIAILIFLNHCFSSMEVEICRDQAKKLVSLSMWSCLLPKRREEEFESIPEWKKFWKKLMKKDKPEMKEKLEWERHFLQNLIKKFLAILEAIPEKGKINEDVVKYCERFLEFIIDLESLLPTRRFFNTVLDDSHLVVRCSISNLVNRPEGKLFSQVSVKTKFILFLYPISTSIIFIFLNLL